MEIVYLDECVNILSFLKNGTIAIIVFGCDMLISSIIFNAPSLM